jgi:hypothetical protein
VRVRSARRFLRAGGSIRVYMGSRSRLASGILLYAQTPARCSTCDARQRPSLCRAKSPSATKSLSRALVAEAVDPLSAPQPVPYPHDLAAPAARAGGHRVRPPGHFAPSDLPARLADELCHRRHVKGTTRPTVESIVHLRVLYISSVSGSTRRARAQTRGRGFDRSSASGFGTAPPPAGCSRHRLRSDDFEEGPVDSRLRVAWRDQRRRTPMADRGRGGSRLRRRHAAAVSACRGHSSLIFTS